MIVDLQNAAPPKPQQVIECGVNKAIPTTHELTVFHTMADQAVSSKMYRGIGEQAGVMMIMLAARELGIAPMQALNGGLNIIQGKVEISARMMNALIRRSGHQISVKQSTDKVCILEGKRADTGEIGMASFTIEEAQRAGLVKPGGGWTKWPSDMCYARALSRLARQLFSDVIGMGYVEGEIKATETETIIHHVEETETLQLETKEDILSIYVSMFPEPDQSIAIQYLEAVKNNFGWEQEVALKNLVNKPNLLDTFNQWKQKRLNQ